MEETNLEKARRLYPIGTTFISVATGIPRTVTRDVWKENYYGAIRTYVNDTTTGYVYSEGKWAKILSYAEPQINNSYEIY